MVHMAQYEKPRTSMIFQSVLVLTPLDLPQKMVDIEVIRQRSNVGTVTKVRVDFAAALAERDVTSILSRMRPSYAQGFHIIPFARGTEVSLENFSYSVFAEPGFESSG